jgi:hypothetical protein
MSGPVTSIRESGRTAVVRIGDHGTLTLMQEHISDARIDDLGDRTSLTLLTGDLWVLVESCPEIQTSDPTGR